MASLNEYYDFFPFILFVYYDFGKPNILFCFVLFYTKVEKGDFFFPNYGMQNYFHDTYLHTKSIRQPGSYLKTLLLDKVQIISECLFDVFKFSKKQRKI